MKTQHLRTRKALVVVGVYRHNEGVLYTRDLGQLVL